MRFSIIIPSYNRKGLLKATLQSVFTQTERDFEVLVVDDGSTDGTVDFINLLPQPITLLQQRNEGPGAARNRGITAAQGEYVAFLDSDDIWLPWALETYQAAITQRQSPAIIIAAVKPFHSDGELQSITRQSPVFEFFEDFFTASQTSMWHGASAIVVKTSHARAVGGFTSEWVNAEDTDFLFRLGEAPGFVRIRAPCTVGYRQHESSAVSNFPRTLAGITRLLNNEKHCTYPGGRSRMADRRRMLSRHIRPATFECLRQGLYRDAWRLYTSTFSWNLRFWKIRYLVGFVLCAAAPWVAHRLPKPVSTQRRTSS